MSDTTNTTTDTDTPAEQPDRPVVASTFSLAAARAVGAREDRGARVALRDELGDPLRVLDAESGSVTDAFALVAGRHSARFRQAEQRVNDRALKRRNLEITAEIIERNELEKVASCVLSWNLTDNGKPIPCDLPNVVEVLRAAPWIRREFETAMGEPSRFLA